MTDVICKCGCNDFRYLGRQGDGNCVDEKGNVRVYELGKCDGCGTTRKISDYYKVNINEEK